MQSVASSLDTPIFVSLPGGLLTLSGRDKISSCRDHRKPCPPKNRRPSN
jgi:hypothetical protein